MAACTSSQGNVLSDQVRPSPSPARMVFMTWTPSAVGTNLAKISSPWGNTAIGIIMPPKAMMTMLNT